MARLYHCLGSGIGFSEVAAGDPYYGSDRGYLSWLMGGKVGFAYAYLPTSWQGLYNVFELELPDDSLVFLAKNYGDVPRESEADWDEDCVLVTAKQAVTLCKEPEHSYAEVVFLAEEAVFGLPVNCLRKTISKLLDKQFTGTEAALSAGVAKVLDLGLAAQTLKSQYTGEPFRGLNLPYPHEKWDAYHSVSDYEDVEVWLLNKPNLLVGLLDDQSWVKQ